MSLNVFAPGPARDLVSPFLAQLLLNLMGNRQP